MATPRIAIIGGGPCGFASARKMKKEGGKSVTIFEKADKLGERTPFSSSGIGAQAMSFNSAEERVGKVLNLLTRNNPDMLHLDDGLLSAGILSRTRERPQGWNRSTGQWEHYMLRDGVCFDMFLRALAGEGEQELRLGCEVVMVGKEGGGKWSVTFEKAGKMSTEVFDSILLALPAKLTLALLENNLKVHWDDHVVNVIRKCSECYVNRQALLLRITKKGMFWEALVGKFREIFCDSEGSHDGHQLAKSWGNMARELDCDGIQGSVALLSLKVLKEEEVELVVHGKVGEELGLGEMKKFFDCWLGASFDDDEIKIIDGESFEQARPEVIYPNCPLAPLRERGCVICVAEDNDDGAGKVVAAGDWAVGQGVLSNAISSGLRAAECVLKSLDGDG